jgi:hypothetical protein
MSPEERKRKEEIIAFLSMEVRNHQRKMANLQLVIQQKSKIIQDLQRELQSQPSAQPSR